MRRSIPVALAAFIVFAANPAYADIITFSYDGLDSTTLTVKKSTVSWQLSTQQMGDLVLRGGESGTYYLETMYHYPGGTDAPYFDITLTMIGRLYWDEILFRQTLVLDDVPYSHYLTAWQPGGHWSASDSWLVNGHLELIMANESVGSISLPGEKWGLRWIHTTAVPEPSSMSLFGIALGFVALAAWKWRT